MLARHEGFSDELAPRRIRGERSSAVSGERPHAAFAWPSWRRSRAPGRRRFTPPLSPLLHLIRIVPVGLGRAAALLESSPSGHPFPEWRCLGSWSASFCAVARRRAPVGSLNQRARFSNGLGCPHRGEGSPNLSSPEVCSNKIPSPFRGLPKTPCPAVPHPKGMRHLMPLLPLSEICDR